ncbi:hypothetical protein BABINDRAFT_171217 [Babjeviella inositovora NRRL Y-12698]|uniref:MATE efflux family protein n=1 Tax=Babjeviella inositovora NRRL Y-12698 TaxID=984486 RepID=A0A1E3QR74_9ASCO|nr:uncharacterized protein BABINDRAFT_171217 [Babjeviella inositovora NRRL Y-12698]ODQ80216.1 hypothetical protein BABINDRAFT_171217 [Babjeviella inositovora NRRL Y-12698]
MRFEAGTAGATTYAREAGYIITSAIPLIVTFFLQYCLPITSLVVLGHLGPSELAAASLAVMTYNITGLAIFEGMTTSLDTLCAQAYGSGNYTLVGAYFQRASAMMLTLLLPMALFWFNSGAVLRLVVDDDDVCAMAQTFLRVVAFGAPGYIFFESGKRFVQSQRLFNACTYVLAFVAPLNFALTYALVYPAGLGFVGAPIAVALMYWLTAALLLLYVVFVDGRKCWGGLDISDAFSFQNWAPIGRLALPGVVMVLAEFSVFEILTLLSSFFGTEALAAQSIATSLGSLIFQLPFALAVGISTRIAHYVGSRQPHAAQVMTHLSYAIGGVISVFNFMVLYFGRYYLARLFSLHDSVIEPAAETIKVLALVQLCDGFNVTFAGVLRGQGRQRIGSVLNLVCYYLIALPSSVYLAFSRGWELDGLWAGYGVGVVVLSVCEGVLIWRSDWAVIVREAQKRIEGD